MNARYVCFLRVVGREEGTYRGAPGVVSVAVVVGRCGIVGFAAVVGKRDMQVKCV